MSSLKSVNEDLSLLIKMYFLRSEPLNDRLSAVRDTSVCEYSLFYMYCSFHTKMTHWFLNFYSYI